MAGFMDSNQQFMIRTNVWSRTIKELLLDELNAMKFVRIISDLNGRSDKISLYAGNSLELLLLLSENTIDWTISRKGINEHRERISLVSWDNGRGRYLFYISSENQY